MVDICGVEAFDFPDDLHGFDCVVAAVAHDTYRIPYPLLASSLRHDAVVLDNEGVWPDLPAHARDVTYRQAGDPGWIDSLHHLDG